MADTDTIFAVSSGRPPAAIAVIRVSGPGAIEAAGALCDGRLPPPRRAALRTLRAGDGAVLDHALVLVFPGPATATGEDLVELHCHGGRAVVAAVEAALGARPGVRTAEAGEFTRRALTRGRIDLAQAEGLADLLAAETETARRAAIASVEGRLGAEVSVWRDRAMQIAAEVETQIDFSDEDDVSNASLSYAREAIGRLRAEMDDALARPSVERLREGMRVVLAGPRNAGKSSLFNALVERDAAIVSPIAGTTRDRVEAAVRRNGRAYLIVDTAGLAEATDDPIEAIGIARARGAIDEADLVLWLGESAPPVERALWIWSRADERGPVPVAAVGVSVRWPDSVAALWNVVDATDRPIADRPAYNARQRRLVEEAAARLADAGLEEDLLLMSEQLRLATRALAEITGVDATEAMLDALFGQFCIGK